MPVAGSKSSAVARGLTLNPPVTSTVPLGRSVVVSELRAVASVPVLTKVLAARAAGANSATTSKHASHVPRPAWRRKEARGVAGLFMAARSKPLPSTNYSGSTKQDSPAFADRALLNSIWEMRGGHADQLTPTKSSPGGAAG